MRGTAIGGGEGGAAAPGPGDALIVADVGARLQSAEHRAAGSAWWTR